MRRIPLVVVTTALALVLAACDDANLVTTSPAAGGGASSEPADAYLVGLTLEELPDDVRVARVGDETYALTADYVVGRRTVELDVDDDGVARVVLVTVEADHGLVTFPD